jgi:FSR family fosmidomycin resistance protein-like MFS transporter
MASPAQPVAVAQPAFPARSATFLLVLFCLGHFFVDLYSGALPALQPLLVERFGLTFTQVGLLGGMMVFSGSVLQPVYGYLSDRFHSRLFAALAPAVSAVFISALGVASGYGTIAALIFLGGAGIASFHPQGASSAVAHVTSNRSRSMAIFICAGSLGMAVGPAFFSAVASGGLARTPWCAIPGVLVTVLLVLRMPAPAERHKRQHFSWAPLRAVWKPMTILFFLVFIRSIVQITFTQFLPLYLHGMRGYSLSASSWSLTAYLVAGTLGGLAGGNLADRFGGRRIIQISMLGSVPFLALFLFTGGTLSAAGLFLGGLVLLFTNPVNVVMAQELAPTQSGTVSALMMGFAWGTAGLVFIPLTGWVADLVGLQTAFTGLIAFPLLGFLLALRLPK